MLHNLPLLSHIGNSQKIKYPLYDALNDSASLYRGDALHYRSAHPIKVGGLLLRLTLKDCLFYLL